jgi:hypothetical protein
MYIAKCEIQVSHVLRINSMTFLGHVTQCGLVDGANILQQAATYSSG